MNQLEDLLRDAGEGPVSFDHRDIARRVRHHRRRTRLVAVVGVVVLGTVGLVIATAGDDEQVVDSIGRVDEGPVTVDELVEDRWVGTAYSAVNAPPSAAFLDFAEDGSLSGSDGCTPIEGDWKLDGPRLESTLRPSEQVPCSLDIGGFVEILETDPTVGRLDDTPGTLQVRSGDDFVAFQRFDRLGDAPTAASIEGKWAPRAQPQSASGRQPVTVTFAADGVGRVDIFDCSAPFEWELANDLSVDGLDPHSVACDGGAVGEGLFRQLTASPRLRLTESTLLMSSPSGVLFLQIPDDGGDTDPVTTTLPSEVDDDDAEELIADFLRFANQPSADTIKQLPFAAEVGLGLGPDIHQVRSSAELADSDAWIINVDVFRAGSGPFSALEHAADAEDTVVSVGEHLHCASPPMPAPGEVADHVRVSVQADLNELDSCLQWWTVDFYLNDSNQIEAVTLDVWEP